MKKRNFILIEDFLKTNELPEGTKIFNKSAKTNAYWSLGTWKAGKVWSNAISMTLEPEKQYVHV